MSRQGQEIKINYTNKFLRQVSQLRPEIIERVKQQDLFFRENPFDSRLDTHKLKGKERGVWSFWVTGSVRVKFVFLKDKEVLFLEAGTHDIYF